MSGRWSPVLLVTMTLLAPFWTGLNVAETSNRVNWTDWTVTNVEVCSYQEFNLTENIIIPPGARLELNHCTITFKHNIIETNGIDVQAGGELILDNTTVNSSDNNTYYFFHVHGKATISCSIIERVWKDPNFNYGGVEVRSGDFLMDRSTVRHCQRYDVYIDYLSEGGKEARIQSSDVSDAEIGIKIECGAAPQIISSNITRIDYSGIQIWKDSHALIEDNHIWSVTNGSGIQVTDMSCPIIKENNIEQIAKYGIFNTKNCTGTIDNNDISSCYIGIVNNDGCHPKIRQNDIIHSVLAGITNNIASTSSPDPLEISNNTISLSSLYKIDTNYGIFNELNSSPEIICNTISEFNIGIGNCQNSRPHIERNDISVNSYAGIKNWDFSNPDIDHNTIILNGEFGILNYNNSNTTISNNIINNNNIGVNNSANSVSNISFNVIGYGSVGIRNMDLSSSSISNTNIAHFTQCIIGNSPAVLNLTDNEIYSYSQVGIKLSGSSNSNIIRNSIHGSASGIGMEFNGTSIVNAKFNTIRDNDCAVKCTESSNLTLSENILSNNNYAALTGEGSSTILSSGNTIKNNKNGISCTGGCRPTIHCDNLTSNDIGIIISQIQCCTIFGVNISGGNCGINVSSCSPSIFDATITDSLCGIYYANSSAPTNNTTIVINEYDSGRSPLKCSFICAQGSNPWISNSTIIADFSYCGDLLVRTNSHPVIINSAIGHSRLNVSDGSSLTEYDYARVNVKDHQNRPLGNVTVSFDGISYHGSFQNNMTTNASGVIPRILLKNATYLGDDYCDPVWYNVALGGSGDAFELSPQAVWYNRTFDFQFDFKPMILPIPDQEMDEDMESSFDISPYIKDPDHETSNLHLILSGGSENNKNVNLTSGALFKFFYSKPVEYDIIHFTVDDGIRNTTASFKVVVKSVDDPIVYNGSRELEVYEGLGRVFNLLDNLWDEDDPKSELRLSIMGDNKYAEIDDDRNLVLNYSDQLDNDQVDVLVQNDGNALLVTFNISIILMNDAPEITHFPIIEPTEDILEDCDLWNYTSDPDSPKNSLTIKTTSKYITCSGLVLHIKYPEGIDTENITLTVSDGINSNNYSLTINIIPFDNPPFWKRVRTVNVTAGEPHEEDLENDVDDNDSEPSSLFISTNSSHVTVIGFRVIIRYPKDWSSKNDTVLLYLSDGNSNVSSPMYINIKKPDPDSIIQTIIDVTLYLLLPLAIIGGAAGIIAYRRIRYGWYDVKRAFLIHTDGRMIANYSQSPQPNDDMLVSSMLTAVQQFIEEAMRKDNAGSIKEFQYEDMKIAMEKGDKLYLAVFLQGYATDGLRKRMKGILGQIERDHANEIVHWDGMMTDNKFISQAERGLKALLKRPSNK